MIPTPRPSLRRLVTNGRLRATLGSMVAGGTLQLTVAASGILAARLLGVTNRGHLALLWVVTLVIGQLSTAGLHLAIAYVVAGGASPGAVVRRLRRVLVLQLLLTPVVALPVDWALFHTVHAESHAALLSTLVVPPAFVLLLYGIAIVQGERRYRAVQLHRLVQPGLYVVVLAVLAASHEGTLSSVTIGWSATMTVGGLFAWRQGLGAWWPKEETTASVDERTSPRRMLHFSVRALFSGFGIVEHLQADQLLAGLLLGANQFGLYTAGSAFANLPRFLGQSIGYVAYPEVSAIAATEARKAALRFVALGALLIGPIVAVLIVAVPWLLPALLGNAFRPAVPVAQILLAGSLLQALRRVAAEGLRGLGSGVPASVAELAFVVVFLSVLVPLISSLYARGAALATVIASVAAVLVLLGASWRRERVVAKEGLLAP